VVHLSISIFGTTYKSLIRILPVSSPYQVRI